MREWNEPVAVKRDDINSTVELIQERARLAPTHIAFRIIDSQGEQSDLTLPEFLDAVDRIAFELLSFGLQPGECCCLLGSTSYGWALVEWAIWRAGGVVVPIYETSPVATICEIINQTDAKLIFADRLLGESVPISVVDFAPDGPEKCVANLARLNHRENTAGETEAENGAYFVDQNRFVEKIAELDAICVHRDDIASIVYTSGTSGVPQGTVILHRNFIDLVLNVQAAWQEVLKDTGRTVIFLPLAHVLARGLQMICLWAGMRVTYLADPKAVITSMARLQPTFMVIVPRVAQKIRDAIREKSQQKHLGLLWQNAEKTAIEWGHYLESIDAQSVGCKCNRAQCKSEQSGVKAPIKLKLRRKLYDALFYSRVRELLGGKVEFLLSGAAKLDAQLSLLFRGMGVPIMEGYGLTETTAPMAGNRPGAIRSGTVGQLVPGTAVKISDSGEILVKGIGVAPKYLDLQQTEAQFTDGWFHTGDLGTADANGYLTITGRAKDVIVTAGGKTVSPAKWEALMEENPLVDHAVVVGENRPYLGALLIVNRSELAAWAEQNQIDYHISDSTVGEVQNKKLLVYLAKLVESANESVSHAEGIKKIRAVLLNPDLEQSMMTPTLKLKQYAVVEKFQELINSIYRK